MTLEPDLHPDVRGDCIIPPMFRLLHRMEFSKCWSSSILGIRVIESAVTRQVMQNPGLCDLVAWF